MSDELQVGDRVKLLTGIPAERGEGVVVEVRQAPDFTGKLHTFYRVTAKAADDGEEFTMVLAPSEVQRVTALVERGVGR